MEEKINIAKILKDKPEKTILYDTMRDINVSLYVVEKRNGETNIFCDGMEKFKGCSFVYSDTGADSIFRKGMQLLKPSKEMQDWEKFSWKRGDVLISDCGFVCIFKEWASDDYTRFNGCYFDGMPNAETAKYSKLDNNTAYGYIREIENRCGGKLNLETLKIEKAQPEFKDVDIVALVVRKCTHIAIFQSRQEAYIGFHAVLCQNDELLLEEPFREDVGDIELRLATDSEKQQLFDALAKEGKRWDSEKKQIVSLKPAFEIGKLYVFHERDEDGELAIIGELIDKNESEDTLTFGNQYEIENEKFVTDQAFDLRISVNTELREATENEVELFNKHYAIWKKEKEAKEQPVFKAFDKVLVRCGKKFKWLPAFFVRDRGEKFASRYTALVIHAGTVEDFVHCIPYEGHENIAFTDYDIEDLPF